MYTLRCPKRAPDRFQLEPHEGEPQESDTLLGDGYTNLLNVGRKRWVFCLSERSQLAVVVPARRDEFPAGLSAAVADTLARLGVDKNARACELDAMTRHTIGRTRSRSVLGVMTDLTFAAEVAAHVASHRRRSAQIDGACVLSVEFARGWVIVQAW